MQSVNTEQGINRNGEEMGGELNVVLCYHLIVLLVNYIQSYSTILSVDVQACSV